MRDDQADDGRFPDFAPHPVRPQPALLRRSGLGRCGRHRALACMLNYADKRLLEEHFDSAERWVDYVRSQNPDLIWRQASGQRLQRLAQRRHAQARRAGPPKAARSRTRSSPPPFFAHSTELVSKMAEALGRDEDAAPLRQTFQRHQSRLQPASSSSRTVALPGDTQAGYALALHFDLLPEDLRPKAVAHLREAIRTIQGPSLHRHPDHAPR